MTPTKITKPDILGSDVDRRWLDDVLTRYHHRAFADADPIRFLYDYDDVRDREVVGLIAACLAYGNVKAILSTVRRVLETLGPAPAATLADRSPRAMNQAYAGFRYRFTDQARLVGLLRGIRHVQGHWGSVETCLAEELADGEHATVLPGVRVLLTHLRHHLPAPMDHLLPDPAGGSAFKRMLLYLRWMVRKDTIDPGGWSAVHPRQLLVPLDTHIHRIALSRGWTCRASGGLPTVLDVTAALRSLSPDDPTRYDFALVRESMAWRD